MIDSGLAKNASVQEDSCPFCYCQWSNITDQQSIVVILPCEHASCAKCLLKFQKACAQPPPENADYFDDFNCDFSCSVCRTKLTPTLSLDVAHLVMSKKLIPSLNELIGKLPFSKEEARDFLVRLLVEQFEFDICKVETTLFNMIGLVAVNINEEVNHETKQEFFKIARKPVNLLQSELDKISEELSNINDTESEEWESKLKNFNEVKQKLNVARRNAAKDIFERINSQGEI